MAARFVISTRKNGEFQFVLKAANGETVLSSEGYTAKASALDAVASVRKHCQHDENFKRLTGKDGSPYFVLRASNGQVVGQSEMYSSNAARENGVASVAKNALVATVEDASG